MKSELKLKLEHGVCGTHLMPQSLKVICEHIKRSSNVQEVHHDR